MRNIFMSLLALLCYTAMHGQIDANLLVALHQVATVDAMNNIVNPKTGDLVFNEESNAVYVYNGSKWVTGGFKHTPYLTIDTPIEVSANSTATILVPGVNFTQDTEISIPGITIIKSSVLSPSYIELSVTTGSSGYHDIIVNNGNKFNTQWTDNQKNKIHVL